MGGKAKLTIPIIIDRANKIHGNKYSYELFATYENQRTMVPIICPRHGLFHVRSGNHLSRSIGCKCCANEDIAGQYHKKTTAMFIKEANKKHGNMYDYSEVVYTNIHTKVKLGCKTHGVFAQTPASHLKQGNGCPMCRNESQPGGYGQHRYRNNPALKDKPALLYLVRMTSSTETFVKVGITEQSARDVQNFLEENDV